MYLLPGHGPSTMQHPQFRLPARQRLRVGRRRRAQALTSRAASSCTALRSLLPGSLLSGPSARRIVWTEISRSTSVRAVNVSTARRAADGRPAPVAAEVAEGALHVLLLELLAQRGDLTGRTGQLEVEQRGFLGVIVDPVPHGVDHGVERRRVTRLVVTAGGGDDVADRLEHAG